MQSPTDTVAEWCQTPLFGALSNPQDKKRLGTRTEADYAPAAPETKAPFWFSVTVFVCGLVMGTGSTITIKMVYSVTATNSSNENVLFEKPLTTTCVMFIAMMMALPVHFLCKAIWGRSPGEELPIPGAPPVNRMKMYGLLVVPAIFDLIGTALAKVGLMYCSVSVYQLVRSSVIVFCAIFNVTLLGKTVRKYMWFGIMLIMVAMILISSSSVLGSSSGNKDSDDTSQRDKPFFGIAMLLGSCSVAALQYVFEEKAMSELHAPPLLLVGMEGVWGTVLMWGVVFPWAYIIPGSDGPHGSAEDVFDSMVMIKNSSEVQLCLLGFFVTVAGYNVAGILVTKLGSSMWHTILDNFRPISVWLTSLIMYYAIFNRRKLGAEPWNWSSWFELAGMGVLLIGSAIYQGKIKLSCFNYDPMPESEVMATVTPQLVACSPMLTPQLVPSTDGHLIYSTPRMQGVAAPQSAGSSDLPYSAPLLFDATGVKQQEPLETA